MKVQELEQENGELEERVEQLEELVEEYETESVEMWHTLNNHDKCLICMDKMATCVARCGHKQMCWLQGETLTPYGGFECG